MNKVTTAAAWKQAAAAKATGPIEQLVLPSGVTIKVRRPPLAVWVAQGKMPTAFCSILLSADTDKTDKAQLTRDDIVGMGQFVFRLVAATVVEPRLVEVPHSAEEMAYADVAPEDITAIIAYASRSEEVAGLKPFRRGRNAAAPGHDGADVRPPAERAARPGRRPRAGA